MTLAELGALLAGLPGETLVLGSGYEGGFARVAGAGVVEVQELERGEEQTYLGRYATPEAAAEEIDGGPGAEWQTMVGGEPPRLIGVPVTAVVLSREGR
ncbi:hypothetical protein [Tsukamurella pseudospumae]|uniref:Uncharacterized protein n=1 Tax=Tsukamurella pseudospumae TaxID=239498 RepID=A0A138AEA5_9ACTN|nr:hypothetical protein [Tsukamurella pseudospumae]KXP08794.1 hypothetical protein AXK60_09010 [Tsukamurella pseudospumae]